MDMVHLVISVTNCLLIVVALYKQQLFKSISLLAHQQIQENNRLIRRIFIATCGDKNIQERLGGNSNFNFFESSILAQVVADNMKEQQIRLGMGNFRSQTANFDPINSKFFESEEALSQARRGAEDEKVSPFITRVSGVEAKLLNDLRNFSLQRGGSNKTADDFELIILQGNLRSMDNIRNNVLACLRSGDQDYPKSSSNGAGSSSGDHEERGYVSSHIIPAVAGIHNCSMLTFKNSRSGVSSGYEGLDTKDNDSFHSMGSD